MTDVIAGASVASIGSASYAGAICVWAGGNLTGVVSETALLRRTAPTYGDHLGSCNHGLQIADVTGDGAPDLVVISSDADAAATGSGEIDVWAAGAGFTGTRFPSAALAVSSAANFDLLGYEPDYGIFPVNRSCSMLLMDVTGDGVNDVIAVAPYADQGSFPDAGAGYVWAGGAALTTGATLAPTATLLPPSTNAYSNFGFRDGFGSAIHLTDFDDDGILDVAVHSNYLGLPHAEQVDFWFGGPGLVGTPAVGTIAASVQPGDKMGPVGGYLLFADVNDDLVSDLVISAPWHSLPGEPNVGNVYLFLGGPATRGGPPAARALLRAATQSNRLSLPRDVDGDGTDDLLVAMPRYSTGPGANDVGAVAWFRGPLALNHDATQLLTAGAVLGRYANLGD